MTRLPSAWMAGDTNITGKRQLVKRRYCTDCKSVELPLKGTIVCDDCKDLRIKRRLEIARQKPV